MDGLSLLLILIAAVLGVLVLMVGAFLLRRHQLGRTLGTFDASIRLPNKGWRMGVCRYTDMHLEWLRLVSLSPVPPHRYLRSSLELKGWRQPTEAEAGRLLPGSIVVLLTHEGHEFQFAMKYDVYAGLCSWLEAGPVIGIGTWR